jgi:hypothetical protein
MNPNLIHDQALFERLGVQGSASLAMDFDCMYEEILLMDEEDLVAALAGQGRQDDDMGSDALSVATRCMCRRARGGGRSSGRGLG